MDPEVALQQHPFCWSCLQRSSHVVLVEVFGKSTLSSRGRSASVHEDRCFQRHLTGSPLTSPWIRVEGVRWRILQLVPSSEQELLRENKTLDKPSDVRNAHETAQCTETSRAKLTESNSRHAIATPPYATPFAAPRAATRAHTFCFARSG